MELKAIHKYIKDGISIKGNPEEGYTIFTIPTQHFQVSSLEELTPSKFEEKIKEREKRDNLEREIWRLSDLP